MHLAPKTISFRNPFIQAGFLISRIFKTLKRAVNKEDFAVDELWTDLGIKLSSDSNRLILQDLFNCNFDLRRDLLSTACECFT